MDTCASRRAKACTHAADLSETLDAATVRRSSDAAAKAGRAPPRPPPGKMLRKKQFSATRCSFASRIDPGKECSRTRATAGANRRNYATGLTPVRSLPTTRNCRAPRNAAGITSPPKYPTQHANGKGKSQPGPSRTSAKAEEPQSIACLHPTAASSRGNGTSSCTGAQSPTRARLDPRGVSLQPGFYTDHQPIGSIRMQEHRALKWIGGILLGFILVLVLVVALFDWNWLRDPIARKVSRATGRTFAINGDLSVHLSLHPRVIADNVVLGNAEWAREPNMAEIKRLDFTVDLLKLLGGKLAFPELALSEPRIALEVSKDNVPNWAFDGDKTKADQPLEFPDIRSLTIDRGSAIYRDPRINTDFKLDVRTLEDSKTNPEMNLEVAGKGRTRSGDHINRAGALLSLRDATHPYPGGERHAGRDQAARRMLLDPLQLKGEQLISARRRRSGANYPLIACDPPTPAYNLTGFLDIGDVWSFAGSGQGRKSDLAAMFPGTAAKPRR